MIIKLTFKKNCEKLIKIIVNNNKKMRKIEKIENMNLLKMLNLLKNPINQNELLNNFQLRNFHLIFFLCFYLYL